MTMTTPKNEIEPNMILLCLANQFGKKISKLSSILLVYLVAMGVNGQLPWLSFKMTPSKMIEPMASQTQIPSASKIPAYKM